MFVMLEVDQAWILVSNANGIKANKSGISKYTNLAGQNNGFNDPGEVYIGNTIITGRAEPPCHLIRAAVPSVVSCRATRRQEEEYRAQGHVAV